MDAALLDQTNASCVVGSSVERHMYPAAFSLFFIVGFPANCLSLYAAWMLARNGNSTAIYLLSLSVSDLLYTASLPVWILLALQRPIGGGLCSSVAVVMQNSFYLGSGLLCCISVDRYLAVVYPLRFHWAREVRTAAAVSVAAWALEITIHIILLDHTGALHAFCLRRLCQERVPMMGEDAGVALTRIFLGFLVPGAVMTFCFQRIMRSLQRSPSILAEERKKVGLLLWCLLLTYVTAFFPYQTVMLLRVVLEPGSCAWASRLRDPYLVTTALTTLNSTLDPIIYCLINESAQNEIRKVARRVSGSFVQKNKCSGNPNVPSVSLQIYH